MSGLVAFLAHPIRLSEEEIAALRVEVLAVLSRTVSALAPGTRVFLIAGRDDFQARIYECGGWDGWAQDVAQGTCWRDGERRPRYDLIVVAPGGQVGKGTARIVNDALRIGKPVYVYAEGALARSGSIVCTDPDDARAGWVVET